MRVIFQSPATKIWYCLFTNHIECRGNKIFVLDEKDESLILAYEGENAVAQFEHFIDYGRIFNANK